jgi:hypothetical protein
VAGGGKAASRASASAWAWSCAAVSVVERGAQRAHLRLAAGLPAGQRGVFLIGDGTAERGAGAPERGEALFERGQPFALGGAQRAALFVERVGQRLCAGADRGQRGVFLAIERGAVGLDFLAQGGKAGLGLAGKVGADGGEGAIAPCT